jgi:hypothetical protein
MSNAVENQARLQDIRRRMLSHEISYDQAKAEAQPIIDDINAAANQLAKKYKMRAPKLSFAAIMR